MGTEKVINIAAIVISGACLLLGAKGWQMYSKGEPSPEAAVKYTKTLFTDALKIRAVLIAENIQGRQPSSKEELHKSTPYFTMPPRWDFDDKKRVIFKDSPLIADLCKELTKVEQSSAGNNRLPAKCDDKGTIYVKQD